MTQNNDIMGTMEIKKLSLKISSPMVISMISVALYSIIDTIFVSQLGDNAVTAISLSFPAISIITAIALGTGIGVNALLAKTLGQKDILKSQKIIRNGAALTLISYLAVAFTFVFGTQIFFSFFTDNQDIANLGSAYLSIIGVFSLGTFFQIFCEKVLEAYGKTKSSMVVQLGGAIINLILDPIFIFVFGFGIQGAAIATIIGQIIGAIIGIVLMCRYGIFGISEIKTFRLNKKIISEIYNVGLPTIILEAAESLAVLLLNKVLINFSDLAVAVLGIYFQLQKFVMIIIYGLNAGMIPIVAYNYGAKCKKRVTDCIEFFLKLELGVAAIGGVIFFFVPQAIISFYNVSPEIISIGVHAFRILAIGFVFAGTSLLLSAIFQSLGQGTYSLIVSLSRKIIFVIPFVLIFQNLLHEDAIWISLTVAEVLTTGVAVYLFKKTKTRIINRIEQ